MRNSMIENRRSSMGELTIGFPTAGIVQEMKRPFLSRKMSKPQSSIELQKTLQYTAKGLPVPGNSPIKAALVCELKSKK